MRDVRANDSEIARRTSTDRETVTKVRAGMSLDFAETGKIEVDESQPIERVKAPRGGGSISRTGR